MRTHTRRALSLGLQLSVDLSTIDLAVCVAQASKHRIAIDILLSNHSHSDSFASGDHFSEISLGTDTLTEFGESESFPSTSTELLPSSSVSPLIHKHLSKRALHEARNSRSIPELREDDLEEKFVRGTPRVFDSLDKLLKFRSISTRSYVWSQGSGPGR